MFTAHFFDHEYPRDSLTVRPSATGLGVIVEAREECEFGEYETAGVTLTQEQVVDVIFALMENARITMGDLGRAAVSA
ncbi:MAG: hypothetical protein ACRCZD_17815 [Phycicoccus sp.]